jgi:hypothetical protein
MRASAQRFRRHFPVFLLTLVTLGLFIFQGGRPASAAVIYVNHWARNAGDGLNWATAFRDLQDALDMAESGDQIWVAQGTYRPTGTQDRSISFDLKPGVELYGGFKGKEKQLGERVLYDAMGLNQRTRTHLSGSIYYPSANMEVNSYHVLRGAEGCVIDGFYIEFGKADGEDADSGGGAVLSDGVSMTVRNCWFWRHYGRNGGAIFARNGADVTVEDCVFEYNEAWDGGGIYAEQSNALVSRCRFEDGSAANRGGAVYGGAGSTVSLFNSIMRYNRVEREGGALAAAGGAEFCAVNCIVAGNSAELGAAICTEDSTAGITNTIIYYNSSSWEDDSFILDLGAGETTVSYCCVEGGYPGEGNIDDYPYLFTDDELSALSPCIDAGTWVGAPETDLLGRPRHDDPGSPNTGDGPPWVDIGVKEFMGNSPVLNLIYPKEAGESFERGGEYLIRWTSYGMDRKDTVIFILATSSGEEWWLGAAKNTGSWRWRVPAQGEWPDFPDGNDYYIALIPSYGEETSRGEAGLVIETPSSLEVTGPSEVEENSQAQYECALHYESGGSRDVTEEVAWKFSGGGGKIDKNSGLLTSKEVKSDKSCEVRATYGKGKGAITGSLPITVTNVP